MALDSLDECQGCGRAGIMGFCDECTSHGATQGESSFGGIVANAKSISQRVLEYSCQCSSCRAHKEMKTEDGRPWKCLKPNSVGPGGYFCTQCMFEMSYNSYLDKYCYEDETQPVFRDAAGKMQRAREGDVEIFLADVCEVTNKSDDLVVCGLLYNTYTGYCQQNGLKPKTNVEFGGELSNLGIERRRKSMKGQQFWTYSGLTIKEAAA